MGQIEKMKVADDLSAACSVALSKTKQLDDQLGLFVPASLSKRPYFVHIDAAQWELEPGAQQVKHVQRRWIYRKRGNRNTLWLLKVFELHRNKVDADLLC